MIAEAREIRANQPYRSNACVVTSAELKNQNFQVIDLNILFIK